MEPLFLLEELKTLDRLLIDYLHRLTPEQWQVLEISGDEAAGDHLLNLIAVMA